MRTDKLGYFVLGMCFGLAFMAIFIICICSYIPPAIDVYRGKTTLEITYKDGVPVDSVVVFKER